MTKKTDLSVDFDLLASMVGDMDMNNSCCCPGEGPDVSPQLPPSPSVTRSSTPTPTVGVSVSPTATPSKTPRVTNTPTPTATHTPAVSQTRPAPQASATPTPSPTKTTAVTPEPTMTRTPVKSPTPTLSVSKTPWPTTTPKPTRTPAVGTSPTPTRSATPTPTVTRTPRNTPTVSVTNSVPAPSGTATPTPSVTSSLTPTPSRALSNSLIFRKNDIVDDANVLSSRQVIEGGIFRGVKANYGVMTKISQNSTANARLAGSPIMTLNAPRTYWGGNPSGFSSAILGIYNGYSSTLLYSRQKESTVPELGIYQNVSNISALGYNPEKETVYFVALPSYFEELEPVNSFILEAPLVDGVVGNFVPTELNGRPGYSGYTFMEEMSDGWRYVFLNDVNVAASGEPAGIVASQVNGVPDVDNAKVIYTLSSYVPGVVEGKPQFVGFARPSSGPVNTVVFTGVVDNYPDPTLQVTSYITASFKEDGVESELRRFDIVNHLVPPLHSMEFIPTLNQFWATSLQSPKIYVFDANMNYVSAMNYIPDGEATEGSNLSDIIYYPDRNLVLVTNLGNEIYTTVDGTAWAYDPAPIYDTIPRELCFLAYDEKNKLIQTVGRDATGADDVMLGYIGTEVIAVTPTPTPTVSVTPSITPSISGTPTNVGAELFYSPMSMTGANGVLNPANAVPDYQHYQSHGYPKFDSAVVNVQGSNHSLGLYSPSRQLILSKGTTFGYSSRVDAVLSQPFGNIPDYNDDVIKTRTSPFFLEKSSNVAVIGAYSAYGAEGEVMNLRTAIALAPFDPVSNTVLSESVITVENDPQGSYNISEVFAGFSETLDNGTERAIVLAGTYADKHFRVYESTASGLTKVDSWLLSSLATGSYQGTITLPAYPEGPRNIRSVMTFNNWQGAEFLVTKPTDTLMDKPQIIKFDNTVAYPTDLLWLPDQRKFVALHGTTVDEATLLVFDEDLALENRVQLNAALLRMVYYPDLGKIIATTSYVDQIYTIDPVTYAVEMITDKIVDFDHTMFITGMVYDPRFEVVRLLGMQAGIVTEARDVLTSVFSVRPFDGVPKPTPTPSVTPTGTVTPSPSGTPAGTPGATPTPTPSGTPVGTPEATPTPTADVTPSPSGTPAATPGATPSPTAEVTPTPSVTPTGTPEGTPDVTPTSTAEVTPTPSGTPAGTPEATPTPTAEVTPSPSGTPDGTPTQTPTPSPQPNVLYYVPQTSYFGDEEYVGSMGIPGFTSTATHLSLTNSNTTGASWSNGSAAPFDMFMEYSDPYHAAVSTPFIADNYDGNLTSSGPMYSKSLNAVLMGHVLGDATKIELRQSPLNNFVGQLPPSSPYETIQLPYNSADLAGGYAYVNPFNGKERLVMYPAGTIEAGGQGPMVQELEGTALGNTSFLPSTVSGPHQFTNSWVFDTTVSINTPLISVIVVRNVDLDELAGFYVSRRDNDTLAMTFIDHSALHLPPINNLTWDNDDSMFYALHTRGLQKVSLFSDDLSAYVRSITSDKDEDPSTWTALGYYPALKTNIIKDGPRSFIRNDSTSGFQSLTVMNFDWNFEITSMLYDERYGVMRIFGKHKVSGQAMAGVITIYRNMVTPTPTPSVTPTKGTEPSPTPSVTPSITITPSISVTPSAPAIPPPFLPTEWRVTPYDDLDDPSDPEDTIGGHIVIDSWNGSVLPKPDYIEINDGGPLGWRVLTDFTDGRRTFPVDQYRSSNLYERGVPITFCIRAKVRGVVSTEDCKTFTVPLRPTPTPTPTPTAEATPTPTPSAEVTPTPSPSGEPGNNNLFYVSSPVTEGIPNGMARASAVRPDGFIHDSKLMIRNSYFMMSEDENRNLFETSAKIITLDDNDNVDTYTTALYSSNGYDMKEIAKVVGNPTDNIVNSNLSFMPRTSELIMVKSDTDTGTYTLEVWPVNALGELDWSAAEVGATIPPPAKTYSLTPIIGNKLNGPVHRIYVDAGSYDNGTTVDRIYFITKNAATQIGDLLVMTAKNVPNGDGTSSVTLTDTKYAAEVVGEAIGSTSQPPNPNFTVLFTINTPDASAFGAKTDKIIAKRIESLIDSDFEIADIGPNNIPPLNHITTSADYSSMLASSLDDSVIYSFDPYTLDYLNIFGELTGASPTTIVNYDYIRMNIIPTDSHNLWDASNVSPWYKLTIHNYDDVTMDMTYLHYDIHRSILRAQSWKYDAEGNVTGTYIGYVGIKSVIPELPTPTPTSSPLSSPTPTPTQTPSVTPESTPTMTASVTPTISVTPSVTAEATPTVTPSVTPSVTMTLTPSITASVTPSVTISPSMAVSPTPTPSPVHPLLVDVSGVPETGMKFIPYSGIVTAVGGPSTNYRYSVVAPSTLPEGLVLDAETGVISGRPTVLGTFSVAFMAQSDSMKSIKPRDIVISPLEATFDGMEFITLPEDFRNSLDGTEMPAEPSEVFEAGTL